MPTFKHVCVQIHCPNTPPSDPESFNWAAAQHGPVSEYGYHKLRHTPKITTYIPAVTNCPFAVSITILDTYEPKVKGDDRESLAAYVYFDGKSKEETATLLRRGVETWISSRWIEVADGQLAEREFVFRELGLENFLSSLDLSKEKAESSGAAASNRRHSMPAKMNNADDDSEGSPKVKESAGQIRIDLFRVRCEGPVRRGVWNGMFKDNMASNGNSGEGIDTDVDVSHTAGFSEPKPLDRETVSTQSVSHLDPEGVMYASFVFFYRGEHQLRKMGVMKSKPSPTRSTSTTASPSSKKDFASLASSLSDLIPKGPEMFKPRVNGFNGFRESNQSEGKPKSKRPNGLLDDDQDDTLIADELNRDMRDTQREQMKSEEEVRMEEELAAKINSTLKLKRTHSSSSLKDNPVTPPSEQNKPHIFSTPKLEPPKEEPETPAKKRRGSNDADVKSPQPNLTRFNGTEGFGAVLGGSSTQLVPAMAMEEEEEL